MMVWSGGLGEISLALEKEIKLFLNNDKKPEPDSPEEMAKRILNNFK